MNIPGGIARATGERAAMLLGMLLGAGLGWLVVARTADGSLARFLIDARDGWIYVAAFTGVLAAAVAAAPRVTAGVAGPLAVGLGAAAMVTLRPDEVASSHLGAPLGVAAGIALAAALFAGLAREGGAARHPVRRPWSRRARRARRHLQARA